MKEDETIVGAAWEMRKKSLVDTVKSVKLDVLLIIYNLFSSMYWWCCKICLAELEEFESGDLTFDCKTKEWGNIKLCRI